MKQQIMLRSAAVEDYDGNLAVKQDAAINLNEHTFDVIKAVDVLDNAVRGETESKSDEIVCVAVPYSKGWSAKIDGNTAKIYKMNDIYIFNMFCSNYSYRIDRKNEYKIWKE